MSLQPTKNACRYLIIELLVCIEPDNLSIMVNAICSKEGASYITYNIHMTHPYNIRIKLILMSNKHFHIYSHCSLFVLFYHNGQNKTHLVLRIPIFHVHCIEYSYSFHQY